jgi:hypothetical protein
MASKDIKADLWLSGPEPTRTPPVGTVWIDKDDVLRIWFDNQWRYLTFTFPKTKQMYFMEGKFLHMLDCKEYEIVIQQIREKRQTVLDEELFEIGEENG